MQEKNNEKENENNNEEGKPEIEPELINNPQINNCEENNIQINQPLNKTNFEEDNKILNNEDIKIKNNNIKNNNIIDNIDTSFLNFQSLKKNIKPLNLENLSKEQKMEKIENFLHSLLSEISTLKEKGNEYYNNNNFEAAEKQYNDGIKKINESAILPDIDELNGQINDYLININDLNLKLYNNLSAVYIKLEKYEKVITNCKFIIENLNQDHVLSYYRILFSLIELKKVILANYYADIIKKKFGNDNCISKFEDQLAKLEILNREFSDKMLNKNPELKKEVIFMDNDLRIKNEDKKEEINITKYIPYIVGGAALLFIGGRFIYKNLKK